MSRVVADEGEKIKTKSSLMLGRDIYYGQEAPITTKYLLEQSYDWFFRHVRQIATERCRRVSRVYQYYKGLGYHRRIPGTAGGGGRGLSQGMNVAASYSRTISVSSSYEYGCVCLCKRMCAYS